MGKVTSINPEEEPPAVLTETGTGGLFGSALLADRPLGDHLEDGEQARYVLRNKSDGVTVERDGGRRVAEPDGEYQTLAAVTGVRIVIAVGREDGDVSYRVPLADVVGVDVESGMVSDRLLVTATDEDRYEFTCRGDLAPVAEYVDATAQAWARAYTLLNSARDELDAVGDHLGADEFEPALETAETARNEIATARERLSDVGDGALATFDRDAGEARQVARTRPRIVHAARGRHAFEAAREYWREGEYEWAHDRYETAVAAYRDARRAPGEQPTDRELDARIDDARTMCAELASAPLARAEQVAQGAESVDAPAPAANRWETAIDRYRDALWLDWGRENRRFDGDPEVVRERIVDAVDHLVTNRRGAATACREAARDHVMVGQHDAARAAYRTALAHLAQAREVVEEVTPNRETGLDDTVAAVEDELAAVGESNGMPGPVHGNRPDVASDADAATVATAVAEHWREHDWDARVVDGDVVATRERPVEVRAHVSVVHRADETVGPAVVEDALAAAESTATTVPVLATTGELTDAARRLADERGVALLDPAWLVPARTSADADPDPSP